MSGANGQARRLELEWADPLETAARGLELTGLEFIQGVAAGEIPPPPIAVLLGMEISAVEQGRVVFSAIPGERHYNPIGLVHGGLAATLIDSAAGCAIHSTLPPGVGYGTIDLHVTYVGPVHASTGRVDCEARVIHAGSRVATAEARLLRASDGKVLAHGTSTCLIQR